MSSSRRSRRACQACSSSAVKTGGLSGSRWNVTICVSSLLIAGRLSGGNQPDFVVAHGKNHEQEIGMDKADGDPALFIMIIFWIEVFDSRGIVEDKSGSRK